MKLTYEGDKPVELKYNDHDIITLKHGDTIKINGPCTVEMSEEK